MALRITAPLAWFGPGEFVEDAAVVIDRHFVSSRKPDDLPEFCRGILKVLAS